MPTLTAPQIDLDMRPPGNPDDFVDLGWRPVFKEHINRAGQHVGQDELEGITDCCNERILDTNDFAALVVGHTTDDEEPGSREVVGFCGPYRMGKIGNRKPLPCIEARVWAYKKKVDRLRDYPRLSVEFWQKPEDPSHGYFDPICLLGDETPELDLGIHYAKDRAGVKLMRYSKVERFRYAAMPGGSNTFVPGMIGDDDETGDQPKPYSKDSAAMATTLTPADIQQIVAAMAPIVTQQVNEAMAGMKGMQAGGDDLDGDDLGDDLDLDGDADLDLGDDLDGLDDADGLGDDEQPNLDGDDADLDDDDSDDELPEIDDEDSDLGLGDDSDLEDTDEPPGGGDGADDDDTDPPEESDEDDEENMAAADTKKPDEKDKDAPKKYSKTPIPGVTLEQYAKENGELRERYHKAEARATKAEERLAVVESQVAEIRAEKVHAERYAKLNDLRTSGYSLDIEDELKDTAMLNDEQFGRYCDKIVQRYSRAPIGAGLYIPPTEKNDGKGNSAAEKVERYAKEAGDVAKAMAARGKSVTQADYAAIRANVERNGGKYVPDAA